MGHITIEISACWAGTTSDQWLLIQCIIIVRPQQRYCSDVRICSLLDKGVLKK